MSLPKQTEGICQLWNVCNVFLEGEQTTQLSNVFLWHHHVETRKPPATAARRWLTNSCCTATDLKHGQSQPIISPEGCLPEFCRCFRLRASPPGWTERPRLHRSQGRWSGPAARLTSSVYKCDTGWKRRDAQFTLWKGYSRLTWVRRCFVCQTLRQCVGERRSDLWISESSVAK